MIPDAERVGCPLSLSTLLLSPSQGLTLILGLKGERKGGGLELGEETVRSTTEWTLV